MNSNKSIGFQLFGPITLTCSTGERANNLDQTYEIEWIPGEVPQGTVSHEELYENKPIAVELPKEIQAYNYEKACDFLLQHNSRLFVSDHGHAKLGNRKLLVELAPSPVDALVNILVFVQGKTDADEYRIELNPYDISYSFAEIKDVHSKEFNKVNIHLGELQNLKEEEVKNILRKLKPNNFEASIKGNCLYIHLGTSLNQWISKHHPPASLKPPKNSPPFSLQRNESEQNKAQKKPKSWFRSLKRFLL